MLGGNEKGGKLVEKRRREREHQPSLEQEQPPKAPSRPQGQRYTRKSIDRSDRRRQSKGGGIKMEGKRMPIEIRFQRAKQEDGSYGGFVLEVTHSKEGIS